MKTQLDIFLETNLNNLKNKGLYNIIDTLDGANGSLISINNKEYINLSSNNYLGLANHPALISKAIEGLQKYGVGAGAVRPINGTLAIHKELEESLAKFKGTESAIVYQSGFNCNMGAIGALMTSKDLILSDQLNHASIIDGCRLSKAQVIAVKHSNMEDFKAKIQENIGKYEKIMYITDGVFSMDGDLCKLPEIVKIAKEFNVITYVDDAHGSGVTGKGAGTVKHFGLQNEVDLQIGTLSKAIGVVGGYVAGKQNLIDWLKVSSRPFLFSTSLMPVAASACIEAISMISTSTELHDSLWENSKYLKQGLKKLGFNIGNSETPITPCIIGEEKLTQEFSKCLMNKGVYAKAIVYPTVPLNTGRIRNMPIASHTKEMLNRVLEVYAEVGKELNII